MIAPNPITGESDARTLEHREPIGGFGNQPGDVVDGAGDVVHTADGTGGNRPPPLPPTANEFPNRRGSETFAFEMDGIKYHVTYSLLNGKVGEVFINAGKVGSPVQALTRDMGLILSFLLLGGGMSVANVADRMTKLDDGRPAGPLGYICRQLAEWHP